MKMKAKALSLVLCMALLVTMTPINATVSFADSGDVCINSDNFPDEVFREVVTTYDTNRDGYLSESECEDVTELDLYGKKINSIGGVEVFPNLKSVFIHSSPITSIDISGLPNLEKLECLACQLTSIKVGNLENLKYLILDMNNLESIDVSGCPNLEELGLEDNNIINLDVSANQKLKIIKAQDGALTSITIGENSELIWLDVDRNSLETIDVSGCPNLEILRFYRNKVTNIDVSKNTKLTNLLCGGNAIETLDVSKNVNLEYLDVWGTKLKSIDVSNNPKLMGLEVACTNIKTLDISSNPILVGLVRYRDREEYDYEGFKYYSYIYVSEIDYFVEYDIDTGLVLAKAPASGKANLTTAFSKTGAYNDIKVQWSASQNADGYYVYCKKGDGKYTYLGKTTKTNFSKKDLAAGAKYTFKITPYIVKEDGSTIESAAALYTSTYTLKKLATPTVTKSGTKVKVKWTNIAGESGYQISKSTKKTGTNIVATYATTKGTYKLVSATKGKTYYYKVRAYKVVNGTKIFGPWSPVKAFKR